MITYQPIRSRLTLPKTSGIDRIPYVSNSKVRFYSAFVHQRVSYKFPFIH